MNLPTNVRALPGVQVPTTEPRESLVRALQELLVLAQAGRLQSFVGTGFMSDGARMSFWSDHHPNVYEMRGAIAWLQDEYVARHEVAKE